MARGGIDWTGVYAEYTTFDSALSYADADAYVNKAVTCDGTGNVVAHASADGKFFLGVVQLVDRDGAFNVQTGRFIKAPTASIVAGDVGKQVVCDGLGGVRIVNTAVAAEVAVGRGSIFKAETGFAWILV